MRWSTRRRLLSAATGRGPRSLVTVHEGIQYHFGKISFTGDLVFYPNTELLDQLKPFTSNPYTPDQVTNMQRAVVYYYKTHGYYDPKVDVQSDPKTAVNGFVPVAFDIESGDIYRFGGVSQEGFERLSPRFLPDRFASLKGKFYNPKLLDDKFREMMQTGLFRQLRIEPRPQPDNTIELHMVVEEEKAKELGIFRRIRDVRRADHRRNRGRPATCSARAAR